MNSDGKIAWGDDESLKKMGFHMPITELEAAKLEGFPENKRLAMLSGYRHNELKEKRGKFPGQATAHLVGANSATGAAIRDRAGSTTAEVNNE